MAVNQTHPQLPLPVSRHSFPMVPLGWTISARVFRQTDQIPAQTGRCRPF